MTDVLQIINSGAANTIIRAEALKKTREDIENLKTNPTYTGEKYENVATMPAMQATIIHKGLPTVIKFSPRDIAGRVDIIINIMCASQSMSFLQPYLEKPVLFSFDIETAYTNGARIVFNPAFAQMLLIHGRGYIKNDWENVPREEKIKRFHDNSIDYRDDKYFTDLDLLEDPQRNIDAFKMIYTHHLIMFVLVHECYHQVYNHIEREILLVHGHPTKEQHKLANIAADIEINRDIEGQWPSKFSGATKIIGGWWWEDVTVNGHHPKNEVFEEIYEGLSKNPPKPKHQHDMIQDNTPKPKPKIKKITHSDDYRKGWNQAMKDFKDGKLTL